MGDMEFRHDHRDRTGQDGSRVRTVSEITPKEMGAYRAFARRREHERDKAKRARRRRAMELAESAAAILKRRYGAKRVAVFGSVLDADRFSLWSDVDVVAWGLRPDDTLRAMGEIADLGARGGIPLNLVDVNTCRETVLKEIAGKCVDL